jgi:N-acetylglucosaminyldiphosphoundecaprenol N-acetyl-beta-D-mannosaminyltransferase
MSTTESERESLSTMRPPCWLFDIPFNPLTLEEAAGEVERLVLRNVPSYLITANTNYAMLVSQHPDLHEVNRNAALIVADGIHMVWVSRMTSRPLPERVTGTDLIHQFSALAARKGYSVFLLGAAPGVAEEAARKLCELYPGLRIAGTAAPMFKDLTPDEHEQLIAQIREARPDLLLLAMGQPQGERWLFQHHEALGVPLSIQIGGSLDYIAGRVPRAPRWMRTMGLEAPHRMCCEPARLIPRYSRNALFLAKSLIRFALSREYRRQDRSFD